MYLKRDSDGQVGVANNYQTGWSPATAVDPPVPQADIDAYDLESAQNTKRLEVKESLSDFEKTGYTYTGAITCAVWNSGTYAKKDLVLATDTNNYKSLKNGNTDNEPPNATWWEEYEPIFKTKDKVTSNIILKNNLPPATPDRWIFGAKQNIPVNFDNATDWDSFFDKILPEKDRIMRKYDNYLDQVDLCTTVAQVDAIIPDFSP